MYPTWYMWVRFDSTYVTVCRFKVQLFAVVLNVGFSPSFVYTYAVSRNWRGYAIFFLEIMLI